MTDTTAPQLSRDQLRAQIFKTHKQESRVVEFFGSKIELRQPSFGDIVKNQDESNKHAVAISILMHHAFVPETLERVFEETDLESLLALPFGPDFVKVVEVFNELTTVNFQKPEQD